MQHKAFEHGSAQDVAQAHRDPDQLAAAISPDEKVGRGCESWRRGRGSANRGAALRESL